MHGTYIGNNRMLVSPAWGGKLLIPSDDLSLAPDLILTGVIELPLTNYLIKNVKGGWRVIDAGANVGYFTTLLGLLVGPGGQVMAYEPNPLLYAFLMDNLSINYLHTHVTVHQKAVYSSAATIPLHLTKRFMGNTSIHQHNQEYCKHYVDEIEKIEVEAEPLDTRLNQVGHVDLIKLDIEGGEYHAFLGMQKLLTRNGVETVVFELNKTMLQQDWHSFSNLLKELYYKSMKFFTLSPEGDLINADLNHLLAEGSNPFIVMKPV